VTQTEIQPLRWEQNAEATQATRKVIQASAGVRPIRSPSLPRVHFYGGEFTTAKTLFNADQVQSGVTLPVEEFQSVADLSDEDEV